MGRPCMLNLDHPSEVVVGVKEEVVGMVEVVKEEVAGMVAVVKEEVAGTVVVVKEGVALVEVVLSEDGEQDHKPLGTVQDKQFSIAHQEEVIGVVIMVVGQRILEAEHIIPDQRTWHNLLMDTGIPNLYIDKGMHNVGMDTDIPSPLMGTVIQDQYMYIRNQLMVTAMDIRNQPMGTDMGIHNQRTDMETVMGMVNRVMVITRAAMQVLMEAVHMEDIPQGLEVVQLEVRKEVEGEVSMVLMEVIRVMEVREEVVP